MPRCQTKHEAFNIEPEMMTMREIQKNKYGGMPDNISIFATKNKGKLTSNIEIIPQTESAANEGFLLVFYSN